MPAKEACPSLPAGCGRDGRRRMAALVNSRAAVRLLGSASLRGDAVGRRGAQIYFGRGCAVRAGAPRGRGSARGVAARGSTDERSAAANKHQSPTTRRFQSIPRDPHAMEAGTARLRGRPHRMLRARVVLDRAAISPSSRSSRVITPSRALSRVFSVERNLTCCRATARAAVSLPRLPRPATAPPLPLVPSCASWLEIHVA